MQTTRRAKSNAELAERNSRDLRAQRALRSMGSLREAPGSTESPFAEHESDEQHEERGHVPQLALLDDGDAAAAVADGLGQRRRIGGREEAAACLVGDPLQ